VKTSEKNELFRLYDVGLNKRFTLWELIKQVPFRSRGNFNVYVSKYRRRKKYIGRENRIKL